MQTVDELRALVVERRAQEQAATYPQPVRSQIDYALSLRNLEPARLDAIEDLLNAATSAHFMHPDDRKRLLSIAARMLGGSVTELQPTTPNRRHDDHLA